VDALNIALFLAGALVFVSVLAGLYSARAGVSFLLVFLVAGMLAGEDGPGGIVFNDFKLSLWVGSAALAVILLDGGLRTPFATFRTGLKPAAWLATLGVLVTAGLTAVAAAAFFNLPPLLAMLVGAIIGSTDAAAVFSLLKSSGLRVNERLAATLEIESGLNDPMAVFLVLALTAWAVASGGPEEAGWAAALWMFVQQAGVGALAGVAAGHGVAALLRRLPIAAEQGGLTSLLLLSSGLAVFAGSGWLGGSGFLSVYLFGLLLTRLAPQVVQPALGAMDGLAWLSQAALFLLLGLLVTPSQLWHSLLPALGVALVLMFVARPVAVALCLAPQRFTRGEVGFVSWVGLRGAVPVVLAVFPVLAGVPQAALLFDIAFVVVLASLLLQGATMTRAARLFGVNLPDAQDEGATRAVFGDFSLGGQAPLAEVCAFYGLELPDEAMAEPGVNLHDWLCARLKRPPVVGDGIDHAGMHFAVRAMRGGRITQVGLGPKG
jgi:cell volume regulation protein A